MYCSMGEQEWPFHGDRVHRKPETQYASVTMKRRLKPFEKRM